MDKVRKTNVLMASYILHSRTQSHIFHFKTNSYAQHKALQGYYEGVIPLIDSYIEGFQGKYGILSGYKSMNYSEDISTKNIVEYFNDILVIIDKTLVPDSYLKNILDSITELIRKTIYLLLNLK
jgi:hypothetical protein